MPGSGTTTYGDLDQRTAAWAAAQMLAHAEPVNILNKFAAHKEMPMNKANVVKFRRMVPFSAATTPLQEGVTPTAQKMSYEDVEATMRQYGAFVQITDVAEKLAEDPVFKNALQLCGEQGGSTIEQVIYGEIKAGTNVTYSNGTVRTDVNTPLTLSVQRKVTRSLKEQKAKKLTSILSGSAMYGTLPIEASYVAVSHTNLEGDIRSMAGFIPVARYGNRQPVCPEEIGQVEDVRYVLSPDLDSWANGGGAKAGSGVTMISTAGTSADVYPVIYIGKDSYGSIPLRGASAITPMLARPKPVPGDELGQRGSVAWKTFFAAKRLNETWLHRVECAATD